MLGKIAKRGKEAVLFTDNASYYTSKSITKAANKMLKGGMIQNVPYFPKLNCIEIANRAFKQYFRKTRLDEILKKGKCNE